MSSATAAPASARRGPLPAFRLIRAAWLPALVALLGAASLAWLAVTTVQSRRDTQQAHAETQRIADLRGIVTHLDEVLTMSARMAAATGDRRWIARYEEAEPVLDAAIAEAVALASPEAAERLAAATDAANRRLVAIEREAFGLVAAGRSGEAAALLDGEEYEGLKALYAAGLDAFGRELALRAEQRAEALAQRSRLSVLAILAVVLAVLGLGLRWHVRLRRSLAETERVARTDPLTSLPNRRGLSEALAGAMADGPVALMLLDLDGFKSVNDQHGHAVGDALLAAASARLRGVVRQHDVAARLGGDEFAVLLRPSPGTRVPEEELRVAAEALAGRIVQILAEPFALGPGSDTIVRIGASVGVALAPRHATEAAALLHAADLALYGAKEEGRGRFALFHARMEVESREQAALASDLRAAVAAGEIRPFFQPLAALADGRVIGHEMLARWPHPTLGLVPPERFIPLAERLGLIAPLTRSLLAQALRHGAAWEPGLHLSFNLSPLLLNEPEALVAMLREELETSGFPPTSLEVEITESALVGDLALARRTIEDLRALGVRVALDDFGTGYSGLRLLSALPVDRLKIDGGFVRRMHDEEASARIVASVVALARGLGLGIVAEGVGQPADVEALRALGCEAGQGWLFGRPLPPEALDGGDAVRGKPLAA